ncbi:unnamed protein product [Calypogeia fissa]
MAPSAAVDGRRETDAWGEIEERLKKLNVDSTFVVDPEHRPKLGPNPDNDNIPVIDMSPFLDSLLDSSKSWTPHQIAEVTTKTLDGNNASLQGLISEVGMACENWGFFQVTNHGVPLTLVNEIEKIAREFFDYPLEDKRRIRRTFDNFLGYFESELTKNKRDWKEVIDIACSESLQLPREVHGEDASEETIVYANQWPENPPGFREICEKYILATETLASHLLGIISLSLGLPFDHFHPSFEDDGSFMRLNYYSKCPIPDLILGVGRHKDSGALTVLVQDEVGGLQVSRKDGEWISVQPQRDAFVINVGDVFQVWSNDKYRSIEHRVVVNENKDRFSFPLFYMPSCKALIEPVKELLDEAHPPKYRAYSFGMFQKTRNGGNFKKLGENIQIHHFAI